jgi:NAD(P)-dependent dehydrogenase (short-subunit alcohol dehydrogenase family)
VNCICPGYIETEMNTEFFKSDKGQEMIAKKMLARRLGQPEELEGAILLLASDSSSFMNGSVITVDGGHVVGSI